MTMDSSSVVSAQVSVARSEAPSVTQSVAPSVAASEPGIKGNPRRRRQRQTLRKSLSTSSLDSNENGGKTPSQTTTQTAGEPRRRSGTPRTSSSNRRSALTKTMSMSGMNNGSISDHLNSSGSRLLQKSRSRRQLGQSMTDRESRRHLLKDTTGESKRQLQKTESRRQLQASANERETRRQQFLQQQSESSRRLSQSNSGALGGSPTMTTTTKSPDRRTSDRSRLSSGEIGATKRSSSRRTTSGELTDTSRQQQQRRRSKSETKDSSNSNRTHSNSNRNIKDGSNSNHRQRRSRSKSVSGSGRRKSDRERSEKRERKRTSVNANGETTKKRTSNKSSSSELIKSSSHLKTSSHHNGSRGRRRTSRRPSDEDGGGDGKIPPSTSHRPRSVSAGPSSARSKSTKQRRSSSINPTKKRTSTSSRQQQRHSSGLHDLHMSMSENIHRTRLPSTSQRHSMHQSLSHVSLDWNNPQSSRPPSRRDMAKRKSVRASKLFHHSSTSAMDASFSEGGGQRRRRRDSRAIKEHDLLQMSVSELNHNELAVTTVADPLTLSPDHAANPNNNNKNIYGLGVLSASHLDKQPANSPTTPAAGQDTGEIVKVQFVQSGGKVVPLHSKTSPKDVTSSDMVPPTPVKGAKKKLQTLLGFTKTPKKSKRGSTFSKYQTFGDDEDDPRGGARDDSTSPTDGEAGLMEPLGPWEEVDAAIPILQL